MGGGTEGGGEEEEDEGHVEEDKYELFFPFIRKLSPPFSPQDEKGRVKRDEMLGGRETASCEGQPGMLGNRILAAGRDLAPGFKHAGTQDEGGGGGCSSQP